MSKLQVMSWDYERLGTGFRFFVFQDLSNSDLRNAFELQISARLFGAQIGHADVQPITNRDIIVDFDVPTPGVGPIHGRIDDWQSYRSAAGTALVPVEWTDPDANLARLRISGFAIVKGLIHVTVGSHVFDVDIHRAGATSGHPAIGTAADVAHA